MISVENLTICDMIIVYMVIFGVIYLFYKLILGVFDNIMSKYRGLENNVS